MCGGRAPGDRRLRPQTPGSLLYVLHPLSQLRPHQLLAALHVFCLLNPSTIFCPFQPRETLRSTEVTAQSPSPVNPLSSQLKPKPPTRHSGPLVIQSPPAFPPEIHAQPPALRSSLCAPNRPLVSVATARERMCRFPPPGEGHGARICSVLSHLCCPLCWTLPLSSGSLLIFQGPAQVSPLPSPQQ